MSGQLCIWRILTEHIGQKLFLKLYLQLQSGHSNIYVSFIYVHPAVVPSDVVALHRRAERFADGPASSTGSRSVFRSRAAEFERNDAPRRFRWALAMCSSSNLPREVAVLQCDAPIEVTSIAHDAIEIADGCVSGLRLSVLPNAVKRTAQDDGLCDRSVILF